MPNAIGGGGGHLHLQKSDHSFKKSHFWVSPYGFFDGSIIAQNIVDSRYSLEI